MALNKSQYMLQLYFHLEITNVHWLFFYINEYNLIFWSVCYQKHNFFAYKIHQSLEVCKEAFESSPKNIHDKKLPAFAVYQYTPAIPARLRPVLIQDMEGFPYSHNPLSERSFSDEVMFTLVILENLEVDSKNISRVIKYGY